MTDRKPVLADLPNWPRLLSEGQAATYVGVSLSAFRARIGNPWPAALRIGRRKVYDRIALDRAVDALSRPAPESPAEAVRRGR